jgi:hypothetical protein
MAAMLTALSACTAFATTRWLRQRSGRRQRIGRLKHSSPPAQAEASGKPPVGASTHGLESGRCGPAGQPVSW